MAGIKDYLESWLPNRVKSGMEETADAYRQSGVPGFAAAGIRTGVQAGVGMAQDAAKTIYKPVAQFGKGLLTGDYSPTINGPASTGSASQPSMTNAGMLALQGGEEFAPPLDTPVRTAPPVVGGVSGVRRTASTGGAKVF